MKKFDNIGTGSGGGSGNTSPYSFFVEVELVGPSDPIPLVISSDPGLFVRVTPTGDLTGNLKLREYTIYNTVNGSLNNIQVILQDTNVYGNPVILFDATLNAAGAYTGRQYVTVTGIDNITVAAGKTLVAWIPGNGSDIYGSGAASGLVIQLVFESV